MFSDLSLPSAVFGEEYLGECSCFLVQLQLPEALNAIKQLTVVLAKEGFLKAVKDELRKASAELEKMSDESATGGHPFAIAFAADVDENNDEQRQHSGNESEDEAFQPPPKKTPKIRKSTAQKGGPKYVVD